jgi:hypothetical protein
MGSDRGKGVVAMTEERSEDALGQASDSVPIDAGGRPQAELEAGK